MPANGNDILAFILELVSIFLYVRWTTSLVDPVGLKVGVGLVTVVVFGLIWGAFFAPQGAYGLSGLLRWTLEFIVLWLPAVRFLPEQKVLPVVLALVIVANLYLQATIGRGEWS